MAERHADEADVALAEPASERLTELGDLVPELALRQLRQRLGVSFAVDEGAQHLPAGHPEHVRRDRVELDASVL